MYALSSGQCVVSGIVTGALTGLLIGALGRADIWAPVPLPTRGPSEPANPPMTAAAEPGRDIAR